MERVSTSACLRLPLFLSVINVGYLQELYFMLNGVLIPPGSSVVITDIGLQPADRDDPGSTLVCVTTDVNIRCCRSVDNDRNGPIGAAWRSPDGALIPSPDPVNGDTTLVRVLAMNQVRLVQSSAVTGPVGRYTCEVPNPSGENVTASIIITAPPPTTTTMTPTVNVTTIQTIPSSSSVTQSSSGMNATSNSQLSSLTTIITSTISQKSRVTIDSAVLISISLLVVVAVLLLVIMFTSIIIWLICRQSRRQQNEQQNESIHLQEGQNVVSSNVGINMTHNECYGNREDIMHTVNNECYISSQNSQKQEATYEDIKNY